MSDANIIGTGKLDKLKTGIKKYKRAMVAFSGGADSAFLLSVCADVLGRDNVIAVTASSGTVAASELTAAKKFASVTGVSHIVVETDELNDPAFLSNPPDRCYLCKKIFYPVLFEAAKKENIIAVFDGSNADDSSDYRPGRIAAREFGIISPLMEAGLSKDDIRAFSRKMKLSTWDKPANPCLASRIPYGDPITLEKLKMIDKAETFIHDMGFRTVRVRHHGDTAKIELPDEDLARFMDKDTRSRINHYLKGLGFIWVSVDIEGYRTGSLNKGLSVS